MKTMNRTYSELCRIPVFKERFEYLKIENQMVGQETFGFDRYINQRFYRSVEWRRVRDLVIIRDSGNDLGFVGHSISGKILVHHMNPIDIIDIEDPAILKILDPEYLISCSQETHQAIHYSSYDLIAKDPIIRTKGDTVPWPKK